MVFTGDTGDLRGTNERRNGKYSSRAFFVYKLNEKVSEKMLLRANCYVELILGSLKSNM